MTTQTFDLFGNNKLPATVTFDGTIVSTQPIPQEYIGKIDCDLRAEAVAAGKPCTLLFLVPADAAGQAYVVLITMPANAVVALAQHSIQEQLASAQLDLKVATTGKFDCVTAAAMVIAHQSITNTTVNAQGWPLDAAELRMLLDTSSIVRDMIGFLVDTYAQQNGVNIPFVSYSTVLPDDTKAIKFHRAEIPEGCSGAASAAKGTRWGLIAAVGIGVAGVIGATYAISQRRKQSAAK